MQAVLAASDLKEGRPGQCLRQIDTVVISCPIWLLLGEFTALYQAVLEGSTSPSQYTALQLNNGTLQTVGSRLLDTKATSLTCTRGRAKTHQIDTVVISAFQWHARLPKTSRSGLISQILDKEGSRESCSIAPYVCQP